MGLHHQSETGRNSADVLGGLQLSDYLQIVRRRKAWIVLTATALCVMAAVVAFRMPNMYKAETTIMVDPQKVPDTYVPTTVTTTIMDRLSTIRQQINSPTRLAHVIATMNLYPELRGQRSEQDLAQMMQKSITVDVVDAGAQRTSAFRIGFYSRNPVEAAQVANELTKMVIQENLKARQQQFSGAAEFLDTELNETKQQLEKKEAELQRIKSSYIMDLPESKQYHLEALTNLRNQLRAAQDRVNRAHQEKVYLQSLLLSSSPTVDMDIDSPSGGSTQQSQIQKLESKLSELRSRYGPNFPDVRKTQVELDRLLAKAAQDAKSGAALETPKTRRTVRNPVIEAQLNKLDQEVDEQSKSQATLEQQINFHSSKLERVPIFEQQIAGLMRDYDTLRGHYNRLLDKKLAADMASELESRQKGERFTILDSAQAPEKPYGPNRPLIILAGLIGGLLGGMGLAVLIETQDESVRTEKDAASALGKVVLAGIPKILSKRERLRNRLRAAGAFAGTVAASAVVGFALSFVAGKFF